MASTRRSRKNSSDKLPLTRSTNADLSKGDVTHYLEGQSELDLLRFITCGSVDDGKSTLIGRMLYRWDTSTTQEVTVASVGSGWTEINLARQPTCKELCTGIMSFTGIVSVEAARPVAPSLLIASVGKVFVAG